MSFQIGNSIIDTIYIIVIVSLVHEAGRTGRRKALPEVPGRRGEEEQVGVIALVFHQISGEALVYELKRRDEGGFREH